MIVQRKGKVSYSKDYKSWAEVEADRGRLAIDMAVELVFLGKYFNKTTIVIDKRKF